MKNVSSLSSLNFFQAQKYDYVNNHTVNNSSSPRPHFCMGLLLNGSADFFDCTEQTHILLNPGEIIFVPISSRYISKWYGAPTVSYIGIHFSFNFSSVFSRQKQFLIQKISACDFSKAESLFSSILGCTADEGKTFHSLSCFFEILSEILPNLHFRQTSPLNSIINPAVDYIEKNYRLHISAEKLARLCNMSTSRFFPAFKASTGLTPTEYITNHRINCAVSLLLNNPSSSVENISCECGFESASYFRKVFKKITGKSPTEYRKSLLEM